jgi:hypothetical protein
VIVDFVHLGCFNADGTVIGGKSLVQPGHHAADTGRVVDQVYFGSIFGGIYGTVDAGNSASDDQDRVIHGFTSKKPVILKSLVDDNEIGMKSADYARGPDAGGLKSGAYTLVREYFSPARNAVIGHKMCFSYRFYISVMTIAFDLQTAVQVRHPMQFCGRTGTALCGISNTSTGHILMHSSQESQRSASTYIR